MSELLEVPYTQLSDDALLGIIEEFITREGTDYGFEERSLESKVSQVKQQIIDRDILIIFDPDFATCNLIRNPNK